MRYRIDHIHKYYKIFLVLLISALVNQSYLAQVTKRYEKKLLPQSIHELKSAKGQVHFEK